MTRRRVLAAIVGLLMTLLVGASAALAQADVEDCRPLGRAPARGEVQDPPFWTTSYFFTTVRPNSVTTDGQSLFFLDHAMPKIVRLPLHEKTVKTCSLPTPWEDPAADDRKASIILLGPRAFYIASTTVVDDTPTIFRADRFPTALRGGWRMLRQLGGPAALGIAAVAQDNTLFALRSGPRFEVDWQPIESVNQEAVPPAGATVDLAPFAPRPAAGVTVSRDTIYVFGGRNTPNSVTRIPLLNRAPGTPDDLPALPNPRVDAQALIHAGHLYLVGGNAPGKPTIERTRLPIVKGRAVVWEKLPEPSSDGGEITAATFARGLLWLVRADGRVETMRVDETSPGRALVTWDRSIRRQQLVRKGDTLDIEIPWSYTGPLEISSLTAEVRASPLMTDSKLDSKKDVFASLTQTSFPGTILPPATRAQASSNCAESSGIPPCGPTLRLHVTIPLDRSPRSKARTEYVAVVTIRTGSGRTCLETDGASGCLQRIGPPIVLRFLVDKRPPTPTPTP